MHEFLLVFASLQVAYWAGYAVRWLQTRPPKVTRVFPENLTPEFKAWLADYLSVNRP